MITLILELLTKKLTTKAKVVYITLLTICPLTFVSLFIADRQLSYLYLTLMAIFGIIIDLLGFLNNKG